MKKCKVCGSVLEDSQSVCPYCNTAYTEKPAAAPKKEEKDESLMLLLKYADFMDDEMLYRTAACKQNGIGVEKNEKEAFELYRVLAFRGNFEGMFKLAEMYLAQGDEEAALKWLRVAADGGHTPSKLKLSMVFNQTVAAPQQGAYAMERPSSDLESLVREALPSIVMIEATRNDHGKTVGSLGSGFIIEGGLVVTNEHVVGSNPQTLTAHFEDSVDERYYNLRPVYIAEEYDLAVLSFTGIAQKRIEQQQHLSLRLDCNYGEEVYTIGNPIGLGFSVSRGVVSNPSRGSNHRHLKEVVQTDITANPGNSGGALLDKENNVVGVITYHPGNIEGGITMCVPSSYVVEILNKIQ